MQYLDKPYFRKEGLVFVLYKVNFQTDDSHPHTIVGGGAGIEVGRYSTESELQEASLRLFKIKAEVAIN